MIRTQIQLTEEQAERLRRRSKREDLSISELVRRAVDAFTLSEPGIHAEGDRRERAIGAAGRFASGSTNTSRSHDEVLADAFDSR